MKSGSKKILWVMILVYILFFGVFTAVRHYQFQTQAWDMGIFDQLFWNTTHGRFMQSSIEELPNHFGIHFSPILVLLIPGYALFPSPYYLLLMQTIALALGAWPLYLLAKKKLKDPLPLTIAGAYLLYPSLQWINTFDFHEIAFFIPLAIAALYFLEEKKWLPASIFLALAAGTKEDAILITACIGFYILVKSFLEKNKFQKIIGSAITLIALIYFFITIKFIMPSFGGGLLRLDRYQELGSGILEIIKNSVTNPALPFSIIFQSEKLKYMFWLFLPAAFLPFFSWPSFMLILPGILENTLTNYQPQFSSLWQYNAILIPGIFLGVIHGSKFLAENWLIKEKNIGKILLVTSLLGFSLHSPISPFNFPIELFKSNENWNTLRNLVDKIPNNADISASSMLIPHLSQREKIYILGTEYENPVDFLVIDGGDLSGFADEKLFQNYVDNYMNSGNYTYEEFQNRYFILKRKALQN